MERRYLLTRFDRRRRMSFDIAKQMDELFGADQCKTVISENVSIAESPAIGRDVFAHAANSRGAQDYASLLQELQESGFLPAVGA